MILSLSSIDFNDNNKDNDHNLDDTNDNIQGSFTFVFPPPLILLCYNNNNSDNGNNSNNNGNNGNNKSNCQQ